MNKVERDHIDLIQRKSGGVLRPADVLRDAQNPNSPLHPFFTWDDTEAAQAFRLIQAKAVIRVAVRFLPTVERPAARALVNTQQRVVEQVRPHATPAIGLRRRILEAARQQGIANAAALLAKRKAAAFEELRRKLVGEYQGNVNILADECLAVEFYARGLPIGVLAGILDVSSDDPDYVWNDEAVLSLIREMAVPRPEGWLGETAMDQYENDQTLEVGESLYGVKPHLIHDEIRDQPHPKQGLSGGSLRRFNLYSHHEPTHDKRAASLRSGHPALTEGRTQFPGTVVAADAGDRVLVSGHSNAKVGAFVTKGVWRGMDIFTLTLEERKTCPTSCHLWSECYGNAMPFAKRREYGPALMARLDVELREMGRNHPAGFVVRLHVLGDFPDADYVAHWMRWMDEIPQVHVFGYTAHPRGSEIGCMLAVANERYPERWAVRFSVAPEIEAGPMQATSVWRRDRGVVAEGLVCPASSGDTEACGTCGLCWHPNMADTRIVFLGHGMNRRGNAKPNPVSVPVKVVPPKGIGSTDTLVKSVLVTPALPAPTLPTVSRRFYPEAPPIPVATPDAEAETVTWEDVLPWARMNRMIITQGMKKGEILTMINEQRRRYNLPLWEVVEPNGRITRGRPV